MKKLIYSEKLQDIIISLKSIPRPIRKNEHLKLYHKYWIPSFDCVVKIEHIDKIMGVEYYFLKYKNKFSACITYPLNEDGIYELLHEPNKLKNDIINSDKVYSGAEIKYWFIVNNIDLSSSKYKGYWPYLNPKSDSVLIDYKKYKVLYFPEARQKCQITLVKDKNTHRR